MNERISWTKVLYRIIAHLWWIVYVNIKLCEISKYSLVSYSYTVFGCIWCISNSSKLRVGVQVPTKTAGMTEDRHGYQSWAQPIGLAIHEDFCGTRFTPPKFNMGPENHPFFKGKIYSKSPIFLASHGRFLGRLVISFARFSFTVTIISLLVRKAQGWTMCFFFERFWLRDTF